MDTLIERVVNELTSRRDQLNAAIAALEGIEENTPQVQSNKPTPFYQTAAYKKAQSLRLKRYWANKKKASQVSLKKTHQTTPYFSPEGRASIAAAMRKRWRIAKRNGMTVTGLRLRNS